MWPNLQEIANLVTFTKEILNEKLHFLYSVVSGGSSFLKVKAEEYSEPFQTSKM